MDALPMGGAGVKYDGSVLGIGCSCSSARSAWISSCSSDCEKRNSDWHMSCANCRMRTSGAFCGRIRAFFQSVALMGVKENLCFRNRYS